MNGRKAACGERLDSVPVLVLPACISAALVLIMCAFVLTSWAKWVSILVFALMVALAALCYVKKRKADMLHLVFEFILVGSWVYQDILIYSDSPLGRAALFLPTLLLLGVIMLLRRTEKNDEQNIGASRRSNWLYSIWRSAKAHAVLLALHELVLIAWIVAAMTADWAKWLLIAALAVTAAMLVYDLAARQSVLAVLTVSALLIEAAAAALVFTAPERFPTEYARFSPAIIVFVLTLIAGFTAPMVLYPNHVRVKNP